MAITILPPAPIDTSRRGESSDDDEDGGVDLDGDTDMRPHKRFRGHESDAIVTPGEIITDDSQWMRSVCKALWNRRRSL